MAWRGSAGDGAGDVTRTCQVNIDLDSTGVPWFHPVANAALPVRVVMSDNARWEPEMAKELATPFDGRDAPLVRAVVVFRPYRSFLY